MTQNEIGTIGILLGIAIGFFGSIFWLVRPSESEKLKEELNKIRLKKQIEKESKE